MWGLILLAAVVAVAVLAIVVTTNVARKRRRATAPADDAGVRPVPTGPNSTTRDAAPDADRTARSGLEAALDDTVGRDGRTMRDALDAESDHVDQLRTPDDSGPLLGRALDQISDDGTATEHGTDVPVGDEADDGRTASS